MSFFPLIYGNLNRIRILLLCEKCINFNYAELVHSAFQVYYILWLFYLSILLIFETLLLKLQLKILKYLLKKIIVHDDVWHPQLGIVFTLVPTLILSVVISPLFSSNILDTYQPGLFIFQCHSFLPFLTVHGVLNTIILIYTHFYSIIEITLN